VIHAETDTLNEDTVNSEKKGEEEVIKNTYRYRSDSHSGYLSRYSRCSCCCCKRDEERERDAILDSFSKFAVTSYCCYPRDNVQSY
jgi:hypothetical protein